MGDGQDREDPRPWWNSAVEIDRAPIDLKTDQPHSARIYDYFLGGKDNYPADRAAAEQALIGFPTARTGARENRAFLRRVTRFLVAQRGITQFLDIGTGIPTSPNLHEVAQAAAPDARVVYADNDPIVLAHARALLASTPQGRTAYIDADLRDPAAILASAELRDTLDLTRPVGLSLVAVFHFIPDEADPYGIAARLLDALPAGSYLALSHATGDFDPGAEELAATYRARGVSMTMRGRAAVERFFAGLELVEPGVVAAQRWRPDDPSFGGVADAEVSGYGALARKP
ncbi:SAM-dependent methyltransferase [Frankia sp. AiPs1]|uniref:SAM-dependent methyltransferase n=1 Tax=Frankia sp. AiPs1 TaxID=573493 RepID=UPI002044C0C9|nr:SAM-dependent methyltransferase [Frankia sp. AiPs1]MCM3923953.1 SAM-dependent methyltransferase [Frankia sp. AiPs1]